jgi:hypothetical protein
MDTEMDLVDASAHQFGPGLASVAEHPDSEFSDVSDASFSSESSMVPLPRTFPFVALSDLGDLAHRQAIAEVWVDYLPVSHLPTV